MLRTLSRFTRRIVQTFAPPLECQSVARPNTRFRPALNRLEDREVPANLVFTNEGGTGLMETVANWRDRDTYQTVLAAPAQGDSLTFDGTRSSANLTNLHGFILPESVADFGSISFINNYAGTVTIAPDGTPGLTTTTFTLTSGAIAQTHVGEITSFSGTTPVVSSTDLYVLGLFTWTGGILNSTPSNATVNIYGTGNPQQPNTITLPGEGNTITTGSTLNFTSLGGEKLTTITGLGKLLLNGASDDGIFVRQDAKVARVVQIGTPGAAASGIEGGGKKLVLWGGAGWGYIGTGTTTENLRVENWGGLFTLGTNAPFGGINFGAAGRAQVTLKLTGGNANNPAYGQQVFQLPFIPALQLMSGCVLDVGTNQVTIHNGFVWMIGNTDLAANPQAQTATVKGTYAMLGGSLGFPETIQIGTTTVWGRFKVDGDVSWSGGDYAPGLNCAANNQKEANQWIVTGTMTVDATKPVKPKIVPQPQQLPPGQQPSGQYLVIEADPMSPNAKLQGDDPLHGDWTLVTDTTPGGVKKKWSVKK